MLRNRLKPSSGKSTPSRGVANPNEYLGFLGGQEASKQVSRRQHRLQQLKVASQQAQAASPLNVGTKATMVTHSSPEPTQVQPGNLNQTLSLPPDIQEKINRWREKRQLKDKQSQEFTAIHNTDNEKSNHRASPLDQVYRKPDNADATDKFTPKLGLGNRVSAVVSSAVSSLLPQPLSSSSSSSPPPPPPPPHVLFTVMDSPEDNAKLHRSSSQQQPRLMFEDRKDRSDDVQRPLVHLDSIAITEHTQDNTPMPEETTMTEPSRRLLPPPSLSTSLFDASQQEIMRGQVEFEVKRVLDQLKKERPELVNQAEVMNIVNQKTRKFEDSLQQFNIREQRLRDMVDQMNVTIKAVQSNVDHTKTENGGQYLTEEVMRSWVSFFLGEQLAAVKTDLHEDMNRWSEKCTSIANQRSVELKTLETSLRLLETKFQNTLQSIFESCSFAYGSVLSEVALREKPDLKSPEVSRCKPMDRIMVTYPIFKAGDDRWMKVRTVHPETAQLGEAWIPVLLDRIPYVGNFQM